jgi:hypothetical protein
LRIERLASGENSILQSKVALQGIERNRTGTTGLEGFPSRLAEKGIFEVFEIFFDEAAEVERFGTASFHGQAIQPVLHLSAQANRGWHDETHKMYSLYSVWIALAV